MTKYDSHVLKFRERLARFIPDVVTNYPFEIFASFVGLVIGLTLLAGLVSPGSLTALLPLFVYWAYAVALVLGSLTVAWGLRKRHPLVLASGLQLLGGSYAVYALAVVAVAGWSTAFAAFAAFLGIALVCLVRSLHFRRLIDIARGATNLGRPM